MPPKTPGGGCWRAVASRREPAVLAIDPHSEVLEAIVCSLGGQGYRLAFATSIDEAVYALQASSFEVVLVDQAMERASQGRLFAEISRYPPQTISMIMLARPHPDATLNALRRGAYDCVIKPFEPDLLQVTVARAIERTALARTTRELVEELEAANEHLQRRIDDATHDLRAKVDELDRVRLELEAARRQRDEFIRVIAHELAGPLTAVEGYAEILCDRHMPRDVQPRASAVIRAETRRMARLVEDLTESAESPDTPSLDLGRCDLVELVGEQLELARALSLRHSLSAELPHREVLVWCDRDRLGQVVFNLLSNALKYSDGGEVHVSLTADSQFARVSVVDAGRGIPPEQLETIFEPHVRLVADGPGQPCGSGLGLYVARRLAEAHRGSLRAESNGTGAKFILTLPLAS
jgi:signal transduction histidine kinase